MLRLDQALRRVWMIDSAGVLVASVVAMWLGFGCGYSKFPHPDAGAADVLREDCSLPAPGPTTRDPCGGQYYVCSKGTWIEGVRGTLIPISCLGDAGAIWWTTIRCGDGLLDDDEECDDGNTVGGDGCGMACQREAGWDCLNSGQFCTRVSSCVDAGVASGDGDASVISDEQDASVTSGGQMDAQSCGEARQAICGDGILDADQGEECDLGSVNGDNRHPQGHPAYLCSKDCLIEWIVL